MECRSDFRISPLKKWKSEMVATAATSLKTKVKIYILSGYRLPRLPVQKRKWRYVFLVATGYRSYQFENDWNWNFQTTPNDKFKEN